MGTIGGGGGKYHIPPFLPRLPEVSCEHGVPYILLHIMIKEVLLRNRGHLESWRVHSGPPERGATHTSNWS